ncbi:MotA/TolQ/ExbB proton channel family protein [Rhodanobacter sp. B2A1Ga4]|uniref:MotA/TolQ/ExbB proton channel family protein n=1 Tax=Rhodanobacter sp. B2A1Ga4 TaxID=2778647 RepID=UPI001B375B98|nr:MotA/TolQ/ExbB proton channel family protein [Rhodanobacter sp. B2A1Ga4]MBQ4853949.1 MotA/TolQ/ExbB proton channel family protein [Rhodanobacter sp. B2A1Ga4]
MRASCRVARWGRKVLEILLAGGWALAPILICSAIALAIVLERCWTLRRKSVLPPGLGDEVRQWARSGQLDPKHVEALANGSPLGELLAAALTVRRQSREIIKERIEDTGRHVVHRMERYLNTLGTIALIGPLLGLFGTVIGLIRMFMDVMAGGIGDPAKMAGGIGEALICTAAGLTVAIPAYVLHRYFRSRVTGYRIEMEKQATALLDDLTLTPSPAAAPVRPRRAPVPTAPSAG